MIWSWYGETGENIFKTNKVEIYFSDLFIISSIYFSIYSKILSKLSNLFSHKLSGKATTQFTLSK